MKQTTQTKIAKKRVPIAGQPLEVEIHNEVLARLQRLRTLARQTTRTYLANVEKGILDVSDQLNSPTRKREGRSLDLQTLQDLNETLTTLKVKPEKGRRKDLRKIEESINAMLSLLEKSQA